MLWRGAAIGARASGTGAPAATKFLVATALLRGVDTGGCTRDLGAGTGGGATDTASESCAGSRSGLHNRTQTRVNLREVVLC